jgi:hypothetical protein
MTRNEIVELGDQPKVEVTKNAPIKRDALDANLWARHIGGFMSVLLFVARANLSHLPAHWALACIACASPSVPREVCDDVLGDGE